MKHPFLIFALLLNMTAQASEPGIVTLQGVDPNLPSGELKALDSVIGNAPIVAIGESVHGSSGYIQIQHRLIRYLVEKKGFRTLAFELPLIRSAGLTQWLSHCESAGAAPIDLLQQPIEDERDLMNWLCTFNKSHPKDQVKFRGMDIWDRPWEWQQAMVKINQQLKLGFDKELRAANDHCWFHNQTSWENYKKYMAILKQFQKIPDEDYVPCSGALKEMGATTATLTKSRWSPEALYAIYYFAELVNSAMGYQSVYNLSYQPPGPSWNSRDFAQSRNENMIWIQEGRKKMIIVAHTSHTAKELSPSDWWKMGYGKIRSGVSYLREHLGNLVRTIGLTGYEVSGVQGNFLKPTAEDSLDKVLHDKGYKVALVNPSSRLVVSKDRWWVQNENSADDYPNGVYMVPRDNFDAFIYIDKTLVGKPILPWREVWQW